MENWIFFSRKRFRRGGSSPLKLIVSLFPCWDFVFLPFLIEFALHERHNDSETKHDINEKDYI